MEMETDNIAYIETYRGDSLKHTLYTIHYKNSIISKVKIRMRCKVLFESPLVLFALMANVVFAFQIWPNCYAERIILPAD